MFWQPFHLGDCMFFATYARKLLRALPDFEFTFYCEPSYHAQVLSMFQPFGERVSVAPVSERPADAINTWIGDGDFFHHHPQQHNYTRMYQDWFQRLSKLLGVENPIRSSLDLLMEVDDVDESHGRFDYLVINSQAQSGQWPDTTAILDGLIHKLKRRGRRVAKTHSSDGPADFCTMEAGLNIQQLINFSPCCARVIGVNNAPMVAAINTVSIHDTESWHVCDYHTFYEYPKFQFIRTPIQLSAHIAIC